MKAGLALFGMNVWRSANTLKTIFGGNFYKTTHFGLYGSGNRQLRLSLD